MATTAAIEATAALPVSRDSPSHSAATHGGDDGVEDAEHAGARGDALAAAEAAGDREDVPEDGRRAEHVAAGPSADPQPDERGDGTLEGVEDEDDQHPCASRGRG